MDTEVRLIAPTGCLGYGFSRKDFARCLVDVDPHVIAVDAGSTDPGPYYLGSGESFTHDLEIRSELETLVDAAITRGIPLIVGTSGGSGARAHVTRTESIVRELAREHNWSFRLATIQAELDHEYLESKLDDGAINSFESSEDLTVADIRNSAVVVAQMGPEPIIKALAAGAQVVLAGRACDDAIFAAVPIMQGFDPGLAFHMGKVLECGALASEPISMDVMCATLRSSYFELTPGANHRSCTVTSVAAHSLYERENPILQKGPGGMIDLSATNIDQIDERSVRVSGTRYIPSDVYTVKLEGVKRVGARTISIAGIRCPSMLKILESVLNEARARTTSYFDGMGIREAEYAIHFHEYGRNGVMGALEPIKSSPHEIGLVIDVVAGTQDLAHAVCHHCSGVLLHLDFIGQFNNAGNLAFPFSPSEIDVGNAFEFSIYHLMELDDPCEPFTIDHFDLLAGRDREEALNVG